MQTTNWGWICSQGKNHGPQEFCHCGESRSPGCYPYDGDSLLRGFAAFYELDGDLIRCKSCGRACIASRSGEDFVHAAYCENAAHLQPNPWVHLRKMLNDHVDG